MEHEEFESELGKVAVTKEHFEREARESGAWEEIVEEFPSEKIIDRIHFSEVENLDCILSAEHPAVLVETDEGWGRVFFQEKLTAERFYNFLRYRWQAFLQIHEG